MIEIRVKTFGWSHAGVKPVGLIKTAIPMNNFVVQLRNCGFQLYFLSRILLFVFVINNWTVDWSKRN